MPEMLLTRHTAPLIHAEDLEFEDPCNEFTQYFQNSYVKIKNKEEVAQKLRHIIADGPDKMMVISDFDFTLTKFNDEKGRKYWSSPGVIDKLAAEVNPPLALAFKELCRKYIPIEFNPHLSLEEKIPHMEEFWRISHQLTVEGGFKREEIEDFVCDRCNIALRDGGVEWMQKLAKYEVPFVIFSAGIGDIIDTFLRKELQRSILPPNMHIIANMMEYEDDGSVSGFTDPVIHTFCKNSSVIKKETGFFHQISDRTNVILLGDSLGDTHMDVGVEKDGPTLKIGFLNHKADELLHHFMEIYDVVLVHERTMRLPSLILDAVTRRNR